MNRWLLIPLLLVVVLASLVFAARNADPVVLDLLGAELSLPLGVVVLGALFVGCAAGGLVLWFGVILPLRVRLRRASASGNATA